MGGHTEYPTPKWTGVFLYHDKIILQGLDLEIPYASILEIHNANKEEIAGFLFVGPLGTWWKKNYSYTVLQYKNDIDTRTIVVDFEKNIDFAQRLIYRRMIRFKQLEKENRPREGFLVYENTKYRIRMHHPFQWIEDETNERQGDFTAVTEFRTVIENKSPYITVFVSAPQSEDISLREFADKEIDELRKNPQGYIQEEYIDTVLGNNPALKLIYTDARSINDKPDAVYREMIVWTKFGKMIYEVRYLAKKSEYLEHKPLVEHIMNSFQIIDEGSESKIEKERTIDTVNNEDPVLILKRRFARGEITETDYQRMKRILES